jgi:hypothetical protein
MIINRTKSFLPQLRILTNLTLIFPNVLTDSDEAVLVKGLNFSVMNPHSYLDLACAVESIVLKLPQSLGMEFRWKIRSMLEKSKSSMSVMATKEMKAMKSLRLIKDIGVLQADKGNYMVSDELKYKKKLNTLLESRDDEPLPKDPTAKVERKVQKLLCTHKTAGPADIKQKLTLYHSRPPHVYGLPKIHKPDIPLRPIMSSIGSPCYALADFLHKILIPLAGKWKSSVKNVSHFLQLLKTANLQSLDTLVNFDVVSLFTNVPVSEALQVIKNKLHNDATLAEQSVLQVEAIVELLEVCLRTTYFQVDDKFFQQKNNVAVGSSLSSIVSNMYVKHSEKLALDSAPHELWLWLWYVDDTFMV